MSTLPAAALDKTAVAPKHYYPALDGLRGVAVLIVVLHHFFVTRPVLNLGWVGVDIFFVLSGFLITGILYDSREKPHRVRDFYIRRALRILPLYYGVWLLILLSSPLFHWLWDHIWDLWPLHLGNYTRVLAFYRHNILPHDSLVDNTRFPHLRYLFPFLNVGHFWSLCVEEQFYCIWPAVVFLVPGRKTLLRITILVILLAPFLRALLYLLLPRQVIAEQILYYATPTRADAFMYGALVALLLRGPAQLWLQRYRIRISALTCLVCGLCLTTYFFANHVTYLSNVNPYVSTLGFSLIDLLSAVLLLNALHVGSWAYRLLNLRWLRWLGGISYGVYVFHVMVLPVAAASGAYYPFLLHFRAFSGIALTLLLAQLSHTFYEKPFLRLKDRFTSQVHRTPAA